MDALFKGIDVSRHNGEINWSEVKKAGYTFVIIRIGYGKLASQKDANFEKNYAGALAAGLEIGGYWYSYANNSVTAEEEAKACLQCIGNKKFSYPIYYDVEETNITNNLSNQVNTNIVNAFCVTLEKAGYTPGFYTFENLLQRFNLQSIPYEKWLAKWSSSMGNNSPETFSIWQHAIIGTTRYATINGRVPGTSGDIDVDKCFKDLTKVTGISLVNGNSTVIKEDKKEEVKPSNPVVSNGSLTAGTKITLSNTPLYGSSSSSRAVSRKYGTFYIYSNEVINGKIRITNSLANVGRTPAGSYVTGWIDVTSILNTAKVDTPTTVKANPVVKKFEAGTKITVSGGCLYSSSSTSTASRKLNGTFYIYSNEIINGRIRITNSPSNVGRTPVGSYVTGWVKTSDIR